MAERIDIVIREDGSRQVQKSIKDVGDEGLKAGKSIDLLKKALAFAGIGLTVAGFAALAQEGIQITNVLKNATTSQAEFNAALSATQRTAIETGTSTHALAELYDTLATAGKGFHATQEQTSSITDTIAKAFAAEGKSASEAGGAINGLSRALLTGTADMRGFITILNSSNLLAETMAEQFGLTAGKFVEAVKAGKVSSEDFFKALLNSDQAIGTAFGNTSRTLAQAFGALHEALVALATDTENATGIMGGIADVIIFVAEHLNILVPIVVAFSAAWVAAMIRSSLATGALREAVNLLNLAFARNPFVAIVSVLVVLAGAVYEAYQNWAAFAEIVDRSAVAIGVMDQATANANAAIRAHAGETHQASLEHARLALTGGQAADGLDQVKRAADGSAVALDSYGNVIEQTAHKQLTWLESVKAATEALGGTFDATSSSIDESSSSSVHFGDSINQVNVGLNQGRGALHNFRDGLNEVIEGYRQVKIAINEVNFANGAITGGTTRATTGGGVIGSFGVDESWVRDHVEEVRRSLGVIGGPSGRDGLNNLWLRSILEKIDEENRQKSVENAAKIIPTQAAQISPTVSPQSINNNQTVTVPVTITTPNPAAFGASQDQIARTMAAGVQLALGRI